MPPYLRLVPASACWNASKMIFCFSSGMPMPVSDTSKAMTPATGLSTGWSGLQPPTAADAVSRTPPCSVNLKALDKQVLQHLLQPLGVGGHAARKMRVDLDVERQMPVVGLVAERPRDGVDQVGDEHLLGVHRDGAGLDLRQVEDVADQVEQVGAGAVDGAREFDLLAA